MNFENELKFYQNLEKTSDGFFQTKILSSIQGIPINSFQIVSPQAQSISQLPVLGLVAGVHGIEVVGVKVLHAFVEHVLEQLKWDKFLQKMFQSVRIVGLPIANPTGYIGATRCNYRGVDLMRNAPVECENPIKIIGGHRISPKLPYFRGFGELEVESKTLIDFVENEKKNSSFSLFVDLHSGFGMTDYIWTPYAKQKECPRDWDCYMRLKERLDSTLKHHVYRFEQQSNTYCTHGDLWDFLYDRHINQLSRFLPLTLEIGSWNWIKKSPHMAFRLKNFFNPVHLHRKHRVIRRHRTLFDFLLQITANSKDLF